MRDRPAPQRLRLFESELLEKLTVISPRSFVAIWAVVLAGALYAGWGTARVAVALGLLCAGLFIWSLFEYVMHRFLFHLELKSDLGRRVIFVMHGNHHVQPGDPYRSMMPPIVSVVWAGAIWIGFLLLLGSKGSFLFLGFAIGYVIYDSVHYACHQLPMRGPLLKRLRKHHIRHHYAKREGNYAITSIFWDRLLGTEMPAKKG